MRSVLFAVPLVLSFTALASAQTSGAPGPTTPATPGPVPGVAAPTTGATGAPAAGSYSPTGRPEDSISNSSSAAGNANQPNQVAPQGGGGGR